MNNKRNLFKSLFSLITYKNRKAVKEFYIPEVNEVDNSSGPRDDTDIDIKVSEKKTGKKFKKDFPVLDANKEKHKLKKEADDKTISTNILQNKNYIMHKFNYPSNKDIVFRELTIANKYKAFIVFLDGMVDKITINNFILRPLLRDENFCNVKEQCQLDYILENVIETNQTKKITTHVDVISEILSGNTGLYVDGCDYYIFSETKGFEKRGVDTPQTEGVVIGPQQGFNENLRTNITLIRRIIKNNNLTTEFLKVGETSNTLCAIMYINGLINPAIVKEVKRRIQGVKTDAIYSSGMLEQFIDDNDWSLIPTFLSTERPDKAASHIIEGKAAIIVDGTPFAIIVPVTFHSFLHTPESLAIKWQYGTLLRYIRIIALFTATLLPGLYVALTNYHREMIPTDLLIAIAKAKENVPFPTVVELFLMEIAFELIREAGVRIPGMIGNTLGIIGALILGQAAVEANIVSPILIIVIAVTGLGNFAIPSFELAFGVRILRFIFIIIGGFLGFFGITTMLLILSGFLVNLKSFGVPFLSTTAPKTRKSFDAIARWPVWKQEFRPDYSNALDNKRQPDKSRQWMEESPDVEQNREDGNE